MSWEEQVFGVLDDLAQQAEALYAADRDLEVADRARSEYQQVTLASRLMASVGSAVTLHVPGLGPLRGDLARVAETWCLLRAGEGAGERAWVVPHAAVAAVEGASPRAVPALAWSPLARLGLGSVLRRLADAGEGCVTHRVDGGAHAGVVQRVGQDFVELREGEGSGARTTLVAFTAVAAISSPDVD